MFDNILVSRDLTYCEHLRNGFLLGDGEGMEGDGDGMEGDGG